MEHKKGSLMFQAIYKLLEKIYDLCRSIKDEMKPHVEAMSSQHIDKLSSALAQAQGEYPDVRANRDNPYYKRLYEDMHALLRVIRPKLSQYGLSIAQVIQTHDDGALWLYTRLQHESGQFLLSRVKVAVSKNDYQNLGSALQYYKRFALMGILALTIEYDMDDDDAELAMQEHREIKDRGTKTTKSLSNSKRSYETVTKEQLDELEYELGDYTDIAEDVMEALRIQSLADMPKDKWSWSLNRIREIKITRERGGR